MIDKYYALLLTRFAHKDTDNVYFDQGFLFAIAHSQIIRTIFQNSQIIRNYNNLYFKSLQFKENNTIKNRLKQKFHNIYSCNNLVTSKEMRNFVVKL